MPTPFIDLQKSLYKQEMQTLIVDTKFDCSYSLPNGPNGYINNESVSINSSVLKCIDNNVVIESIFFPFFKKFPIYRSRPAFNHFTFLNFQYDTNS